LARRVLVTSRMRNPAIVVSLLAVVASACAGRQTVRRTITAHYTCDGHDVIRHGSTLHIDGGSVALLASTGDDDRFVGTRDGRPVEYRLPHDVRVDGTLTDTATERACVVRGGYNDVLVRWMRGESMDEIAMQLALGDREAAGDLIHDALRRLHRRYGYER
jgi:hypothetical protein